MEKIECLVALPILPMPVDTIYKQGEPIPLHCTLMHWFWIDLEMFVEFKECLSTLSSSVRQDHIRLVSEAVENFGPNSDIPVDVLEWNSDVYFLHAGIFGYLADLSNKERVEFTAPQWINQGYRPHVAPLGILESAVGNSFFTEQIALVCRWGNQNKQVDSLFPFSD